MTRNRSGSQGAGEVNLALIGELASGKSGNKIFIHRRLYNHLFNIIDYVILKNYMDRKWIDNMKRGVNNTLMGSD